MAECGCQDRRILHPISLYAIILWNSKSRKDVQKPLRTLFSAKYARGMGDDEKSIPSVNDPAGLFMVFYGDGNRAIRQRGFIGRDSGFSQRRLLHPSWASGYPHLAKVNHRACFCNGEPRPHLHRSVWLFRLSGDGLEYRPAPPCFRPRFPTKNKSTRSPGKIKPGQLAYVPPQALQPEAPVYFLRLPECAQSKRHMVTSATRHRRKITTRRIQSHCHPPCDLLY